MISTWMLTGDTHGHVLERLTSIETRPEDTALIILGDAGINFYLNKTDKKNKIQLQETGFTFYCVRGNHEERPENIPSYHLVHDEEVNGEVWIQDDYPNIRFFKDGGVYNIAGYRCLVVGGAYSVDKYYRINGKDPDKWTGWFKDEQLTQAEMDEILKANENEYFDFVFTHTCPMKWVPTDLFLSMIDQSTVDNTMENWMDKLEENVRYHVWCFGHYHDTQLIRPHVEMYYYAIDDLDEVHARWNEYDATKAAPWYLHKSPYFYD